MSKTRPPQPAAVRRQSGRSGPVRTTPDMPRSWGCRSGPSRPGWPRPTERSARRTGCAPKSRKIPVPVRSRPKWSRGIQTRIAHGVVTATRRCSWNRLATGPLSEVRGFRPELHPVASTSEAPRREMPLSAHTNCGGRLVTQALVSWKSLCPHSGFDDAGINAAIHARGSRREGGGGPVSVSPDARRRQDLVAAEQQTCGQGLVVAFGGERPFRTAADESVADEAGPLHAGYRFDPLEHAAIEARSLCGGHERRCDDLHRQDPFWPEAGVDILELLSTPNQETGTHQQHDRQGHLGYKQRSPDGASGRSADGTSQAGPAERLDSEPRSARRGPRSGSARHDDGDVPQYGSRRGRHPALGHVPLCPDVVHGHRAHPRDRHPHGAGCAAARKSCCWPGREHSCSFRRATCSAPPSAPLRSRGLAVRRRAQSCCRRDGQSPSASSPCS